MMDLHGLPLEEKKRAIKDFIQSHKETAIQGLNFLMKKIAPQFVDPIMKDVFSKIDKSANTQELAETVTEVKQKLSMAKGYMDLSQLEKAIDQIVQQLSEK